MKTDLLVAALAVSLTSGLFLSVPLSFFTVTLFSMRLNVQQPEVASEACEAAHLDDRERKQLNGRNRLCNLCAI
jgi:hypothetical protein